jgi:competence protein ComEC
MNTYPWFLSPKHISTCTVQGTIIKIGYRSHNSLSFDFQTKQINHHPMTRILHLFWHRAHSSHLHQGQQWQLTVRIKPMHVMHNPGETLQIFWFMSKHIVAHGYVYPKGNQKPLTNPSHPPITNRLEHTQQRLTANMRYQGLIAALTLGKQQAIKPKHWRIMRRSGTAHLLAISGLHVATMAYLLGWIMSWIWSRSATLCLWLPNVWVKRWSSCLFAAAYTWISGFGLPASRALLMLLLAHAGQVFACYLPAINIWCYTLIIMLIMNPFAWLSASFWLSFAAVFWLITTSQTISWHQHKWRARFAAYVRMQIFLFLGLLPLSFYFFNQANWASILTNALAIPTFTFIIVPTCFLGLLLQSIDPSYAHLAYTLANNTLAITLPYLAYFAQPYWLWHHHVASIATALFYQVMLYLFLKAYVVKNYHTASIYSLIIILVFATCWWPTPWQIDVLEVGQGLAILIHNNHHAIVYDTGPKFNQWADMGKRVLIPAIRAYGIDHIDLLIISHSDNDHSGGSQSLIQALPIKQIITSKPKQLPYLPAKPCVQGQTWHWHSLKLMVLNPPPAIKTGSKPLSNNDASCVVKIITPRNTVLLPGDISSKQERYLSKHYPKAIRAKLLIAAHHGSKTSSCLDFLIHVAPHYIIFSTGWLNHFHMPQPIILARSQKIHAIPWNTAIKGCFHMNL